MGPYLLLFAAALLINTAPRRSPATTQNIDSDRDGISDEQEQMLLERFRPAFMISKNDCAVETSRFEPNHEPPKALAQDGTIYGQVFPVSGNRIEIHYYTLWNRDCGRMEHPLDTEHASVLISMDSNAQPKALYWYAGAHEKTACDISSGGRAEALTTDAGHPMIWSSSGKHALFLRKEMCGHGCGADSCQDSIELPENGPVINIGELNRPMNGALWVKSSSWPLADKMDSDFSSDVLSRLQTAPVGTISTVRGNRSIRGSIDGADAAVNGGATGVHHTEAALNTANGHTSKSLGSAVKATGRALKHTWKVISPDKQEPQPR
jgi:hypothetical protein